MVWKLLSGIAAACLGVALYFAIISKNDIGQERALEKRAHENLAEVKTRKAQADETLVQKTTQIKGLEADRDKLKTEVATAESDSKSKDDALETAKKTLDEHSQQLAALQKKIDDAGDVSKLVEQVKALSKDKEAEDAAVAAATAQITAQQEKLASVQKQTERLRSEEVNSRKGVIDAGFTAHIAQTFSDWGFAVLNKGNNGGVIANAELEVKRGRNVIARLKVRNVEQAIAVADIMPGTTPQGYAVRQGDLVVAAAVTTPPPSAAKPTTETKTGATPAAGATPVAPAPAAGGMAADPFGAAPAAPKPAAGDPFGSPAPAAPAPAAGAPAKADDPFGGGAPMTPPAGGGAGTKTSPSTADPFAK